jgi:argininosuccinate lyase
MRAALATDVADWLVEHARVSFKEAHETAGRLVRRAENLDRPVSELTDAERSDLHERLADLPGETWDVGQALDRRLSSGGTARHRVLEQVEAAREKIDQ